ncbi:MAG: alpha/beta fold hydrolase [Candidatus Hodarchaeales archaeon]|jgi:pimeloyl-ACP methyl ester carboxylesterase
MNYYSSIENMDPRMKTLFFIHGAGGDHHSWDLQAPLEKEFNIIAVDLPRHGESGGEELESIEAMSKAIHELVHQEFTHLLPMTFIGHSMGGAIVQQYTLEHPQDVHAAVLVDTGAKLKVSDLIFEAIAEDKHKAVDFILKFAFHEKADRRVVEKSREQMLKCPTNVMLEDFKACNVFNKIKEVKNITSPVLIICGNEDKLTPLKYSNYLHNSIHGSIFVRIAEAGHNTMLEKPDMFNHTIKQFLQD